MIAAAASRRFPVTTAVTKPTVVITCNLATVNAPLTMTFTWSGIMSSFLNSHVTVTQGTLGTLSTSDNIVFTGTFTPTYLNGATFQVLAGVSTDSNGNTNTASSLLSVASGWPAWDSNTTWESYRAMRQLIAGVTTQTEDVTIISGGAATSGESFVNGPNGFAYETNGGKYFNPSNNTLTSYTNSGTVFSGALAPNQKIYKPGDVTNIIDVFDTSNGTRYSLASGLLPEPVVMDTQKHYWGTCLCYVNGAPLIICAPTGSGSFLCIKPGSVAGGGSSGDTYYFIGTGNPKLATTGGSYLAYSQISEVPGNKVVCAGTNRPEIPVIDLTVFDGSGNLTDSSISFPFGTDADFASKSGVVTGLDGKTYIITVETGSSVKILQIDWTGPTVNKFTATPSPALSGRTFRGATMNLLGNIIAGGPLAEHRMLKIVPGVTPTITFVTPTGDPWAAVTDPKMVCNIMCSDLRVIWVAFAAWNAGDCSLGAMGVSQGSNVDPAIYLSRFANHA